MEFYFHILGPKYSISFIKDENFLKVYIPSDLKEDLVLLWLKKCSFNIKKEQEFYLLNYRENILEDLYYYYHFFLINT